MKLFKLEIGNTIAYAAAESLEEMNERKAEVDNTFAFLPVDVSELTIPGYDIILTPQEGTEGAADGTTPKRRGPKPKTAE
ncbi:hypothetical protein OMP38_14485 [Cohnella ginsengisoli]|uniref:Uncharacterized protein n=1 Tax=Cohnella ginsengisoli TaxID=425004 RepID=A0A9X4KGM8_9BACL|nr:hypothetical protein [Cohnella ginsengisoli]MDG0791924.1 hypothetical protein [Cohnella ginsengisoli]